MYETFPAAQKAIYLQRVSCYYYCARYYHNHLFIYNRSLVVCCYIILKYNLFLNLQTAPHSPRLQSSAILQRAQETQYYPRPTSTAGKTQYCSSPDAHIIINTHKGSSSVAAYYTSKRT